MSSFPFPPIAPGQNIHILAPASKIILDTFAAGCDVLRARGFNPVIHPQCYAEDRQSAGTIAEKAVALQSILDMPDPQIIWAAAGGNRTAHLLPLLRPGPVQHMMVGFSDITALLHAPFLRGIFGPSVQRLATLNAADSDYVFNLLTGQATAYSLSDCIVLRPGKAQAPILAGTLSLLTALCGTPYMPDLRGCILAIEDVNEQASRIDRMLWQLREAIPFQSLAGLILGDFGDLPATGRPFGFTLEDIVREHIAPYDFPVVMNAPFGHGPRLQSIPQGATAVLQATALNAQMQFIA
ncbi:MAG: LD-carboxypeptidase [Pseudomonadota bacterium]